MMANQDKTRDNYYFDSYAHIGIHEDMLKDKVRTLSYRDAVFKNPSLIQGKVVLDVGCGTGILSMFAATAGARKVYGVEKSGIVDFARQIIEENNLQDKITILQGSIEEITIPEKVDVIISEWMGYALLYESMLPSVILARDRFMSPTGTMFPSRATMYFVAFEDSEYRQKKFDFWDNVYGLNFSPIKHWALLEPLVDNVPQDNILTDTAVIANFNLNTVQAHELIVNSDFELHVSSDGTVHAFAIWFSVVFDGGDVDVVLTTSPYETSTHWCQSLFYVETPQETKKGDVIKGHIDMRPNEANFRDQDLLITYTIGENTFSQPYKMR
ncbi:S-adenosyl-L-methionine-dependent methyltransferase [Histomonas meleagridis]|uniref:S-adenosyl-L-methionine-dependent methyltransferase n=1 Tax=Histomonas meleagridis TaxID=135588 RepID=UPI00355A278B|nr:S-adenosyl-L-methionine-dependent methyltransferase [Histomonas meleagridis]KAH0806852.1 S-adenosyl-L-methionine-dependent methyltransferase [Histomonas meleagridis]